MRATLFIFTFYFSLLSFAEDQKPKALLLPYCEKLVAHHKDKKYTKKFCDCYIALMQKLDSSEEKLMIELLSGKIKTKDLEKKNYPLAEFAFQAEEDCSTKK